jgi:hypothetical protein
VSVPRGDSEVACERDFAGGRRAVTAACGGLMSEAERVRRDAVVSVSKNDRGYRGEERRRPKDLCFIRRRKGAGGGGIASPTRCCPSGEGRRTWKSDPSPPSEVREYGKRAWGLGCAAGVCVCGGGMGGGVC